MPEKKKLLSKSIALYFSINISDTIHFEKVPTKSLIVLVL